MHYIGQSVGDISRKLNIKPESVQKILVPKAKPKVVVVDEPVQIEIVVPEAEADVAE